MIISYSDAVQNVSTYLNNRSIDKDLSIELTSELKIPSALSSVKMLEDTRNLANKIAFVYSMLTGNGVVIKHKGETICTFSVSEGMTFEDIEFFAKYPAIYRFFIDTVFSVFLKNSYPLLSESRKAE